MSRLTKRQREECCLRCIMAARILSTMDNGRGYDNSANLSDT